jgi:hypothetical protein
MTAAQRVALGAVLLVIAAVGLVYWVYVKRNRESFTARDLRVLRTMTTSLDDLVAANSGYVKNTVRYGDESVIPVSDNCGEPIDAKANAALPATLKGTPGNEWFTRQLKPSGREFVLRLGYYALAGPPLPRLGAPVAPPDPSTPAARAAKSEDAKQAPLTLRRGCSDVPLADLLRPVFNIELAQAFDVILVASSDGHVLYRAQPSHARSLLFAKTAAPKGDIGGSPLQIEELGALIESKGWRETKPLDLAALRRVTRTTNVVLSDDSYVLFSQPYSLSTTTTATAVQQQWIVCGLVASRRFRMEIFAIPAPVVMMATALAILAICAWPFLRIGLMNELEPLTVSDAVLVAICAIIAAAIATLAILDTFAYIHLTSIARQQLKDYSEQLSQRYEDNVGRAAAALESMREKTRDARDWGGERILDRLRGPDPRESRRPEAERIDPVKSYPYIISFAWIDRDGVEQYKFAAEGKNPRVNVRGRQYFADVLDNNLWLSPEQRAPGTHQPQRIPYALQWVRSAATGRVTAAIAEGTGSTAFPAVVMGTDLIDLSATVTPPDVRLAIIDEQGNVVYHSEAQRIGYENLFVECDQNPALRSAVLGRRGTRVETSYWGDNTEMYVRPLKNSPWTLVVFRAKRFVRVLNEETVLLTLMPLVVSSLPYLIVYGVILLIAPRYRAPSLWPDPNRRGDYVRLARLYLILGATYGLAIYVFAPSALAPMVFLFPAQAIVSTYVLLHRDDRRLRSGVAVFLWIVLTLTLASVIVRATPDSSVLAVAASPAVSKGAVLALLAVAAVASLSFFMPAREGGAEDTNFLMSYGTVYRLCGALLLVVAAALPVVGFFKIATHIDLELYAKGSQLRMATMLEDRLNGLASLNALDAWSEAVRGDVLDYKTSHIFKTSWCLIPAIPKSDRPCSTCTGSTRPTVPPLLQELLPNLSEDFGDTRQLQEGKSQDDLWMWCVEAGNLKLDRVIRLKPLNARKLYADALTPQQNLILASAVPLVRDAHRQGIAHVLVLIVLSGIVFCVFWAAADFIAERLLIIDLIEPLWLADVPLSPTLGDHIFLVRRKQTIDRLTGAGTQQRFYDVSFRGMFQKETSDGTLMAIDRSAAGRNVRISDFEYGINDGAINWQKLEWLERLLTLSNRTVIIVSSVSPAYVFSAPLSPPAPPPPAAPAPAEAVVPDQALPPPPPPPSPRARWETLLSSFVWVTQEQLELRRRAAEERTAKAKEAAARQSAPRVERSFLQNVWAWLKSRLALQWTAPDWIAAETKHDPFLARLAKEMEPLRKRPPLGEERQRFLDEIGERARTYYAGLWASCSRDERVLLFQLARNGLLNGKDRRVVRRLMARGFVRREPQLELFSETFRRFVLLAGRDDDLRSAEMERPSRWKNLRGALGILVLAFIFMLFATQKDLLSTAQGLATSITASVPLIIKLLGMLGDRHADAASRS